MAFTAVVRKAVTVLGTTYNSNEDQEFELAVPFSVQLAAAKTGTLTTRTDDNTGTLTMSGGHGITTGARLDLYWTGGSRRGITVGTVATNSVPFDLGSGDALPSTSTAITAMVPAEEDAVFVGDDAVGAGLRNPGTNAAATVVFAESDDSEVTAFVVAANSSDSWFSSGGATNPFASASPVKVFLSHGDSTGSVTLTGFAAYS